MDFDEYFAQEWRSVGSETTRSEGLGGCFDCNICFEFAREPVVTLCGHLYCWPCIYKWLHVQSVSLASDPQCPVCKTEISHTSVVPLYGRGQAPAEAELERKTSYRGVVIPPRPAACGAKFLVSNTQQTGQRRPYRNPYQNHNYNPNPYDSFEEPPVSPSVSLGGTALPSLHHPFVGVFGGVVYATVFGNSESLYVYPNSYHQLMGGSSPRMRRQEMQADKSLHRILIFLFCCVLLCLIVF